ncbi:hypothetical protein ABIE28_003766 [Devosia sp. 2618]
MFFARKKPPSSVSAAPSHLLPRGEKGSSAFLALFRRTTASPSPLVGEGARRADEGALPSANCALWHDVVRALDAKPRSASK